MHSALGPYLDYLKRSGVRFASPADPPREPDHVGHLVEAAQSPRVLGSELLGDAGFELIEHFDREESVAADHASFSVVHQLVAMRSELENKAVLDLGCGTAVMGMVAARFGARVIGSDSSARALELARRNCDENGVQMLLREGSLFSCHPQGETFDLVLANIPHKPGGKVNGLPVAQAGGEDGDTLWQQLLDQTPSHLAPGGRLLFFLHSLPHPRLLARIGETFDLELRSWKLRWLRPGEYRHLHDVFRERHEGETSYLHLDGDREALVACVWVATRRDVR